ncbi:hypothetical protein Aph01nite_43590 [Acrocarpospora phusangensis]|uniref:Uncharacterized protein n=1 Tax=Acrocarpospora phusangensis TaxID=1070424 RepID=A0A919QE35_9ACTN|nr:hypothetical protein [Acrocarpospora phusangensis]GIH26049.1 hypothetical protein Aph01nite_43590 [Acrocarpospora phusangensis]
MTPTEQRNARAAAVTAAVQLHAALGLPPLQTGVCACGAIRLAERRVRHTADVLAAFIVGTTVIRLKPVVIVEEATSTSINPPEGATTMQMNTGQKFFVEVDTEDASGFDTHETIEWGISDEAVATLQISEDTQSAWVVSGAPGSAVLTASIPNLNLSATLAVDVVPAGTATIEIAASEPVNE